MISQNNIPDQIIEKLLNLGFSKSHKKVNYETAFAWLQQELSATLWITNKMQEKAFYPFLKDKFSGVVIHEFPPIPTYGISINLTQREWLLVELIDLKKTYKPSK